MTLKGMRPLRWYPGRLLNSSHRPRRQGPLYRSAAVYVGLDSGRAVQHPLRQAQGYRGQFDVMYKNNVPWPDLPAL